MKINFLIPFTTVVLLIFLLGCRGYFFKKSEDTIPPVSKGLATDREHALASQDQGSGGGPVTGTATGESETNQTDILWTYKNKKHPYQFTYPLKDWILRKNDADNIEVNHALTPDRPEQFIVFVEVTPARSLDEVLTEENLKSRFQEFVFINGQKLARLSLQGEKGPGVQHLTIYDKNLYTITLYPYPVKTETEESDSKVNRQLDGMLQSFKFAESGNKEEEKGPKIKL